MEKAAKGWRAIDRFSAVGRTGRDLGRPGGGISTPLLHRLSFWIQSLPPTQASGCGCGLATVIFRRDYITLPFPLSSLFTHLFLFLSHPTTSFATHKPTRSSSYIKTDPRCRYGHFCNKIRSSTPAGTERTETIYFALTPRGACHHDSKRHTAPSSPPLPASPRQPQQPRREP